MNKLLCSGSAGFIFSNFIRKGIYDKHPYTFASIDKICQPSSLNNMYFNKSHSFHIGDVADTHFIDRIFEYERPEIVVHGAAESFVDASLQDPNKFIHSNVMGTQVIVNACVKWGVKKLILASTDEVNGHLENENDPPWTENSPLKPRNPYAASKAAAELIVQAAGTSFGLNYNITRSSNNYGPRQMAEKLIPKTIKCIVEGKKIPIYGQGLQIRDWTYVADNCDAIFTIIKNGAPNEIYNISANQEFPNIEVVQAICNAMGKGHELIQHIIPDPRPGHDFRYSLDCSKLKALGWKATRKFKDGIIETVNWYKNNLYFIK